MVEPDVTSPTASPPAAVVMYSTTWCGYCRRLKSQMVRAGVDFAEINIEQHPEAAALVESVNGGNQTVPTLVFGDGSAMTNPRLSQVTDKLHQLRGTAG